MKKEDLLNLMGERVGDAAFGTHLRKSWNMNTPANQISDCTGHGVCIRAQKQSQIGRAEDAIGTDRDNNREGQPLVS